MDHRQQEEIQGRLLDCLDVYAMIEGWRDAEEVLRRHVKREVSKVRRIRSIPPACITDLLPYSDHYY